MGSMNGPLVTASLVGALTSTLSTVADGLLPDGNAKALVSVGIGMTASVIAFEVMARVSYFRLRQHHKAMMNLLGLVKKIQEESRPLVEHQISSLRALNASNNDVRKIEGELLAMSMRMAHLLVLIDKKSIKIIEDLNGNY